MFSVSADLPLRRIVSVGQLNVIIYHHQRVFISLQNPLMSLQLLLLLRL